MRVGIGYDVHKFDPGDHVILGGVKIPHSKGLKGHSDADVLTHALMDALLGAAGLRDIGFYFPDTDPAYKGADSIVLLEKVVGMLAESGFEVVNTDSVLIAEQPKMTSFIEAIKTKLAKSLGVSVEDVGVKATTSEKIGFVGREEGLASQSVVLIKKHV